MLGPVGKPGRPRPPFRLLAFCSLTVNALLVPLMLALFWYLDGPNWDNFRLAFEALAALFVGGISLAMCLEWGWER